MPLELPRVHTPRVSQVKIPSHRPKKSGSDVPLEDSERFLEGLEMYCEADTATSRPKDPKPEEALCALRTVLRTLASIHSAESGGFTFRQLVEEYNSAISDVMAGSDAQQPLALWARIPAERHTGADHSTIRQLQASLEKAQRDVRILTHEKEELKAKATESHLLAESRYKETSKLHRALAETEAGIRKLEKHVHDKDGHIFRLRVQYTRVMARTLPQSAMDKVVFQEQEAMESGDAAKQTEMNREIEMLKERNLDSDKAIKQVKEQLKHSTETCARQEEEIRHLRVCLEHREEENAHSSASLMNAIWRLEEEKAHTQQGRKGHSPHGTDSPKDDITRGKKTFQGLGTGLHIPLYLRYHGRVRNRNLSKREVELVVEEVWKEKEELDKKGGERELSDCLYQYLVRKHAIPTMVAEWGYSMEDRLEKFNYVADLHLFAKVLHGELPAAARRDQHKVLLKLRSLFLEADVARNGRSHAQGSLLLNDAFKVIDKFCKYNNEEQLSKLKFALSKDAQDSEFQYEKALVADSKSSFLEELKIQHLEQLEEYQADVQECIRGCGTRQPSDGVQIPSFNARFAFEGGATPPTPRPTTTLQAIRDAWRELDSGGDKQIVKTILYVRPNVSDPMYWDTEVNIEEFLASFIGKVLLKRKSKKQDIVETSFSLIATEIKKGVDASTKAPSKGEKWPSPPPDAPRARAVRRMSTVRKRKMSVVDGVDF